MPRRLPAHAVRRAVSASVAVLLAVVLAPSVTSPSGAAPPDGDGLYRALTDFRPTGARATELPMAYAAVRVDVDAVADRLAQVPGSAGSGTLVLPVPSPDGGTVPFALTRTEVLAPRLAAAHPEIRTFAGTAVDDPTTTVALDLTPLGLHASVRTAEGPAWHVDPAYDRRGTTAHLVFRGSDAADPAADFVERQAPAVGSDIEAALARAARDGEPTVAKTYRLALVSDPTYADYFGPANVLAAKATLINRVNQIYRQDLAISFQLIEETEKLGFETDAQATGADGPCGTAPCYRPDPDPADEDDFGDLDFCSPLTLDRNRLVLGQLVGASAYDVGHIVLGKPGGGIASLGVVGRDYKGSGCTGVPTPKGDLFAIDYVAHELGHQFAGLHTFDGVEGNCAGGNRSAVSSVEPGSGSSVMAYAGICGADDLQPHTDPYFSFRTLDEVNAYTSADLPDTVEVQTVSLRSFDDATDAFTLGAGTATSAAITVADYDRAAVEAAVEQVVGTDVTVVPFDYDPYATFPDGFPAEPGPLDETGFQVWFDDESNPEARGDSVDVAELTLAGTGGDVSGFVGETARGGEAANGGDSAVTTPNRAPSITAMPAVRTVPARTPFRLDGRATDVDGDAVTYLWEQANRGRESAGTALVDNQKVWGPLFRVFGTFADVGEDDTLLSPSPGQNRANGRSTRFFPDLGQVLNGLVNARTGRCPAVAEVPEDAEEIPAVPARVRDCYSEFLPTREYRGTPGGVSGAMDFRLTVRDGQGGVATDATRLRVARNAGPFLVTSQGDRPTLRAGGVLDVRWKVAGTKWMSPTVRIHLSTDGGRTWGRTLRYDAANDGRDRIRVPAGVRTQRARVIVESKGNYFYAVNTRDFVIRR